MAGSAEQLNPVALPWVTAMLMEGRFPRLWAPDVSVRDLRQLLIHRHKLVEIRTRVKNGLQHLAMNRGMQKKSRLWSEAGQKAFGELPLEGWAACRREDLQRLRTMLDGQIGQLDKAAERAAYDNPQARLLMTQPGVGPITSLAFVLTLGDAQVGSSTLLDAAQQDWVSGDRSYREQLAGGPGRRKLVRNSDWALSHPD